MASSLKKQSNPTSSHGVRRISSDNHHSSPNGSPNGLGRSSSTRQSPAPVSARAAARRPPGRSNLSMSSVPRNFMNPNNVPDDDAKAANSTLIGELRQQVQKAETVSDQYRKQLGVLQMRLDDAVGEQTRFEEQAHEKDGKINSLHDEVKELSRQLREMEQAYETERTAMMKDKEAHAAREEELQSTIQRLKETISQKDLRMNVENDRNLSRSPSFRNRSSQDVENGQFAPSSQLQRSPSRNNSKLILQKDKLIESLRLELAEAQIKLIEMENMGGGRQQELERELLEARMANARLMEDNESYQLLLSEKTLNGDFTKGDFMHQASADNEINATGSGSLADELESAAEGGEAESRRRLEAELKTQVDHNKALSLYIERIIGRLLQHEGFEHILDKSDNDVPGNPPARPAKLDKELPPPPPERNEATAPTFLQRAKSVMAGQSTRPKPRPVSQLMHSTTSQEAPATSHPTPHENPETAPRIPLNRSRTVQHRRTRSDQADGVAAANVVGQMYRGPAGRSPPSGPMSPGISPTLSQGPFFSGSFTSKRNSGQGASMSSRGGERDSVMSDRSGEIGSQGTSSSPPRHSSGMNNYTGAVMTQSKLRPLRLVQENQELDSGDQGGKSPDDEEAARKKANRASWISWFNRPASNSVDSTNTTTS
ncbi:uncharacterized protein CIMG_01032 [Coccidioides immitis RS]|uniref:M protein, serotype 2.1 n=3 Tax=Coccidioides immitis TaxID=5501 RepID=A0A0E1RYI8_COCIM|nr:uncharacterized protein CIMG_01032 [Coccidioides immitis RS]EAS35678.2 hypothetical protein CIMG_01032 [Coccidioides immitis RS]KMP00950.1 hypothetical protein CIRG_01090 [Coccidioides immitis RMSCC 2394]KMU72815.1 hypothetical protein CISG_03249 [Coccidioides immitis RMSCC 3703]TPX26099.1 hypothetical protein DIZ76_011558 [Coccidioides immitis]